MDSIEPQVKLEIHRRRSVFDGSWLRWRVPLGSHVSRWALSHSPPSRHNIQWTHFLLQSGLILVQGSGWVSAEWGHWQELAGIASRNSPHNCLEPAPILWRGDNADSRDAFLSFWNPFCHRFLVHVCLPRMRLGEMRPSKYDQFLKSTEDKC